MNDGQLRAWAEALEELRAARKLIDAQNVQLKTANEVIALHDKVEAAWKQKDALSEQQIAELNKALTAKDRAISALEAEVVLLKKQKFTVWKAVKYVVYGTAVGIVVGTVIVRR